MFTSYTDGDNRAADDVVRAFATLGEQRIVSRSSAFRAGSLTAIASEVTLDLLDAQLAPEGAVVDAMSAAASSTRAGTRGRRMVRSCGSRPPPCSAR
jgi:hypothetical protein